MIPHSRIYCILLLQTKLMGTTRRDWIRQASLAAAGLGMSTSLCASDRLPQFQPAEGAGRTILLNSNENAFGPSPKVVEAMKAAALSSNRYPDDHIPKLLDKIAAHHRVSPANLIMGAGSSEILLEVALIAARKKGNAVTAEPSFNSWVRLAESSGLSVTRVPLDKERKLDLEAMRSAVNSDTQLVYVCNPNNPVGNYVEHEKVKAFVEDCSRKCLVLVDEAYTEFAGIPSLSSMAVNNPNIIIAKTFSKIYGLAGARAGYAIAHPDRIRDIALYQAWPNVSISTVTAAAASAALDHQEFMRECAKRTRDCREMVYKTLGELNLEYIPSYTSFLMFNIDPIKCNYEEAMNKKNIMVQHRKHFGGKWCRVSMGTEEEMSTFCNALKSICS